MKPETPWQDTKLPHFPALTKDGDFDVVIVGGGITGLTAAYLAKQAGLKVCLLERDRLMTGDTSLTTAHLTHVTDLRLQQIADGFGRDAARMVWQGGQAAINTIERIAAREEIDCEFRRVPGFLHGSLAEDRDESKDFQTEYQLAIELGFSPTYLEHVPGFQKQGLVYPNQAKLNPALYLCGLAEAIPGDGCVIHEMSEFESVEGEERLEVKVKTGHTLRCGRIFFATHVPLMGKTGMLWATVLQSCLYPYSSYVIGAKLPHGQLPEASWWDTTDPYYYLRVDSHANGDYAIFGGEDHKTGQEPDTESRFQKLEDRLRQVLPQVQPDRRWSGQVIETNDGLPYIGETATRQFAATGFSGNGTTFGTLAAMMFCDWVQARENPWKDLFAMNRHMLHGGLLEYLKQNIDYPYYLVTDSLKPAEAKSTRSVRRGQGKIVMVNDQKAACYRDENGKLSMVSPVCTHMGCLVHFNDAEKTWDCPCHGSRFKPTGEVVAGPAETPLEKIESKKPTVATNALVQEA